MALDPQTAALLGELNADGEGGGILLDELGVAAAREGSRAIWEAFAGELDTGCTATDLLVRRAGADIPVRLYSPLDSSSQTLPLVVYLHGGGWAMGDLDSYDGLARSLCAKSSARVLSVEYRLAPEHPYPAGLEDALYVVEWAADNAAALAIDPARLALMGDSAGGNLATVAARRLHGDGRIALAAQFLLYPMLDVSVPHAQYPSRLAFGGGPYLLTRDSIDVTTRWYLGAHGRPDDPDVSPLRARNLDVLPPTVIVTASHDPLHDEAQRYAALLEQAGAPTRFECFDGTIHAFLSFGVLDIARQGHAYLAAEIVRLLFRNASQKESS